MQRERGKLKSRLHNRSLAQLDRGRRVVEVLKQGQYAPLPVQEQVVSIFAVTEGHMECRRILCETNVDANTIARIQQALLTSGHNPGPIDGVLGWKTQAAVRTPLGAGDFSQYITPVLNSGADVLVLNHYGKDMVNSLTQAVQFGLRDKNVNGKDFQIVVPLFSRLMAQGAGKNIKGIYGSTNWNWSLQDAGSQAFVKSFGAEYGFPPSQAAHTCYVQTLLYANAVEMAGTFNPCGVAAALEGFKFDGMGNGPTEYRAEDHQCFKDVLVVKGNENSTSQFDLLKIVEVTPRAKVEYPHDMEGYAGDLGSCNA